MHNLAEVNITQVNDVPVASARALNHGDMLNVGNRTFQIVYSTSTNSPPVVALRRCSALALILTAVLYDSPC